MDVEILEGVFDANDSDLEFGKPCIHPFMMVVNPYGISRSLRRTRWT